MCSRLLTGISSLSTVAPAIFYHCTKYCASQVPPFCEMGHVCGSVLCALPPPPHTHPFLSLVCAELSTAAVHEGERSVGHMILCNLCGGKAEAAISAHTMTCCLVLFIHLVFAQMWTSPEGAKFVIVILTTCASTSKKMTGVTVDSKEITVRSLWTTHQKRAAKCLSARP